MAKLIQEISVEVSKPNLFQAVVAKQNDCNSRFLKATLVNNGEKIDVTTASKVTINANRPDGESKSFEGVINDDGSVTVPLHSWILGLEGHVDCDISTMDENDEKLTSTKFSVYVERASCNSDDIAADPQYDMLTQIMHTAEEAVEKVDAFYADLDEQMENLKEFGCVTQIQEHNGRYYLSFWIGTSAEYEALEEKTTNCLYIISDDTSKEDIYSAINTHVESVDNPHGVTIEQIGAAPAGYGLGDSAPQSWSEIDSMTSPGHYRFSTNKEIQIGEISYTYAYMAVDAYNTVHACQTLYPVNEERAVVRRILHDKEWGDWEWENPPMNPGVEYRTTERYAGLPVYAKLVTYTHDVLMGDSSATTKENIPHGIENFGSPLSVEVIKSGYIFPYMSASTGGFTKVESVDSTNIVLCNHKMSWNASTWYFLLKYTKA